MKYNNVRDDEYMFIKIHMGSIYGMMVDTDEVDNRLNEFDEMDFASMYPEVNKDECKENK